MHAGHDVLIQVPKEALCVLSFRIALPGVTPFEHERAGFPHDAREQFLQGISISAERPSFRCNPISVARPIRTGCRLGGRTELSAPLFMRSAGSACPCQGQCGRPPNVTAMPSIKTKAILPPFSGFTIPPQESATGRSKPDRNGAAREIQNRAELNTKFDMSQ